MQSVALYHIEKVKHAFISSANRNTKHAVCRHHVMQHHVLLNERDSVTKKGKNIQTHYTHINEFTAFLDRLKYTVIVKLISKICFCCMFFVSHLFNCKQ